jgi:hypothetical protein
MTTYVCPQCGGTFTVLAGQGYPLCFGPVRGRKHPPVVMQPQTLPDATGPQEGAE